MDSRDRFLRVARGQPVDRVPYLEEELRQDVLERWYGQGLSRQVTVCNYHRFLAVDRFEYVYPALSPEKGSLKSGEDFRRLDMGYRNKPPEFLEARFWRAKAEEHNHRTYPLGITGWRGFMLPLFTHEREWDSLLDVLTALHDFPELVKSSLRLITQIYLDMIKLALEHLQFDFGIISEPIASPSGPVISPRMFREFVLPCYHEIIDCFHTHGVRPVVFKSISNVRSILPMVIDAGVDGVWIGQVAGAVDYIELRRRNRNLLLIGGLDANVLAQDEEAIRAEVTNKVPRLLAERRYMPILDDNPRANVSYGNYSYYRRVLRKVCEAT